MENNSDYCIIYDTEFTCWPGSRERNWTGKGEYRELVQIGAICIDRANLAEVGQPFNILIKPQINPELSSFLTELTGITQADIDTDGVPFETAYEDFRAYCGNLSAVANGMDADIINENIALYALQDRLPAFYGDNLEPWLERRVPEIFEIGDICSGTLAHAVGARFDVPAHNALNDVRSILAALHHLYFVRGKPNALCEV